MLEGLNEAFSVGVVADEGVVMLDDDVDRLGLPAGLGDLVEITQNCGFERHRQVDSSDSQGTNGFGEQGGPTRGHVESEIDRVYFKALKQMRVHFW